MHFTDFSISVVAVIDTQYSADAADDVIVVISVWLLIYMINCGPKSVRLLVLGGPKSMGRNEDGPKSVTTIVSA